MDILKIMMTNPEMVPQILEIIKESRGLLKDVDVLLPKVEQLIKLIKENKCQQ